MPKGFVYVLTNEAMPGLVKIGFTMKVPTERAAELATTGVPAPFEVEFYCLVEDPSTVESRVHQNLADRRHSADREFFRLAVAEAIDVVTQHAIDAEHTWKRVQPERARPARVECSKCGAYYVAADYCPKCRIRLAW